jgi:hypothetical protein
MRGKQRSLRVTGCCFLGISGVEEEVCSEVYEAVVYLQLLGECLGEGEKLGQ